MPVPARSPVFFRTPAELRRWFVRHGTRSPELWIGFYRKSSGRTGVTYREALDEALAAGWIDGVKKTVDESRYTLRFTPRRPGSVWSLVNIARAHVLQAEGRMNAAGLRAFQARDEARTRRYSYERGTSAFHPPLERLFKGDTAAWTFFSAQPPGYRRLMTWWVISAKREETRFRRLRTLIECSARRERMK